MSLQLAAQHLAQHGRGDDKMLVHMTPKEVSGLQQLAQMHGGSLTRNPHTGLPEAGFLDSLLPTIIGGAAMVLSDGAVQPWMVGLGVGGVEAARTGSLSKGLMAGLGAYGGAGCILDLNVSCSRSMLSSGCPKILLIIISIVVLPVPDPSSVK